MGGGKLSPKGESKKPLVKTAMLMRLQKGGKKLSRLPRLGMVDFSTSFGSRRDEKQLARFNVFISGIFILMGTL